MVGVNSYHSKALKQIDRIEKKNKEQNYKIGNLVNELDNDYLTKIEEGSVVSLEHSKEGMIYLDELQGNTLVNYCVDGAKELTLNGDIDVEGTNVTLTEGVDNGLVDVICEGNTMVNLYDFKDRNDFYSINNKVIINGKNFKFIADGTYQNAMLKPLSTIKPNTTYTIIVNIIKNTLTDGYLVVTTSSTNANLHGDNFKVMPNMQGRLVGTVTTKSDLSNDVRAMVTFLNDTSTQGEIEVNIVVLEGDWTNREIPPYFEGMKSVGECEGNKIEILSRNKNLWDVEMVKKQNGQKPPYTKNNNIITYFDIGEYGIYVPIKAKKDETLRISGTVKNVQNIRIFKASDNFKGMGVYSRDYNGIETEVSPHYICTFPEDGEYYIRIWCKNTGTPILTNFLAEISSTNTTYVEHKSNKKEISLSEPLRGINEDIKDTIMKINNKWYIKRICKEVIINGDTPITGYYSRGVLEDMIVPYYSSQAYEMNSYALCDELPFYKYPSDSNPIGKSESMTVGIGTGGAIFLTLKRSNFANSDLQTYLNNNPIKCIVKLVNPTYEEITDGELITYLDTTHISNNSTIPCNMKIQNSGYNAIIKPSTQYTVALDTNKSGTIGINLGGAKVTTTNNVATITTPFTLVDDSLRLTGKGIKASKVRLLEGDKTNWIPSYFEGMKSSFEDKLQDDGTYKMEILSNNKNLFDINKRINKSSKYWWVIPKLKANKMSFKFNTSIPYIEFYESNIDNIYEIYTNWTVNSTFRNVSQGTTVAYKTNKPYVIMAFDLATVPSEEVMKSLQVVDGDKIPTDYTPQITNKIQFSSIEPLRGIGDVKDRFVFKDDGKLMIERNCAEITPSGDEIWHYWGSNTGLNTDYMSFYMSFKGMNYKSNMNYALISDILIDSNNTLWDRDLKSNSVALNADKNISLQIGVKKSDLQTQDVNGFKQWLKTNKPRITYLLATPTYEEIPYELQKIILEGYESGTLFFDTNIPPTSTVTYAGETPIVKATRLNKTEVLNNTNDINDNIVPYLMDMDYRVVCLQLEGGIENVSMARLFGGTYEMLQRDILSNRYSKEEYKYRLDAYLSANKITEDEYNKLGDMLND